jgi:hypothetical protein
LIFTIFNGEAHFGGPAFLVGDCELVWAKMNLKGNGNIYICAYYRRNVTDEESIRNFETSVTRASAINNAILIIGGDMNFPIFQSL